MLVRILSALVMGTLVIWGVFQLPELLFNALAWLIMLGGLLEWRRLCSAGPGLSLLAVMAMVALYAAYSGDLLGHLVIFALLACGVLMWLYKSLALGRSISVGSRGCMFNGVASLGLAWLAMVALRDQFGQHSLMLVLMIVWGADTFAYFGGRRFGRTRLAPAISPGKTREGVISGVLMSMLVAVVYTHYFIQPLASFKQLLILLGVSILVALISVVGDLSESKLKRSAGMKDSSHLIPGHGGILDRIDGLVAGIVVYAFYAMLSGTML